MKKLIAAVAIAGFALLGAACDPTSSDPASSNQADPEAYCATLRDIVNTRDADTPSAALAAAASLSSSLPRAIATVPGEIRSEVTAFLTDLQNLDPNDPTAFLHNPHLQKIAEYHSSHCGV